MTNPNNTTAISNQSTENLSNKDPVNTIVGTALKKMKVRTQTGLRSISKALFIQSSIQTEDFMRKESIIKVAAKSLC